MNSTSSGAGKGADLNPLVVAAQKGNCAAQDELFAIVIRPVHVFAKRLLGDPDAAEDCCQEALTSAFRFLDQFNPVRGTFLTWVFTITRHAASKTLRARRGAPRSLDELPDAENIASSREMSPLEVLAQRDEAQANRDKLDRIESSHTDQLQAGFRARRAGWTYRELARFAEVKENTARSWMFRSVYGFSA